MRLLSPFISFAFCRRNRAEFRLAAALNHHTVVRAAEVGSPSPGRGLAAGRGSAANPKRGRRLLSGQQSVARRPEYHLVTLPGPGPVRVTAQAVAKHQPRLTG